MTVKIFTSFSKTALPLYLASRERLSDLPLSAKQKAWIGSTGYTAKEGTILLLPDTQGKLAGALFASENRKETMLELGCLGRLLPGGEWYFEDRLADPFLAMVGLLCGSYLFARYQKKSATEKIGFFAPEGTDVQRAERIAESVFLGRDLVNTPASDLGPYEMEMCVKKLASRFDAQLRVLVGDELLKNNLGMIHAVGRACDQAPRLLDLCWGRPEAPRVSLVGKGVCFDTGGLDLKSPRNMESMKKDMGGAASVLALASMIMSGGLDVRLRVLIPAVENSVSGNSFRPGDVLIARDGTTVEVGDTDAEGRLILADTLSLADEDTPDVLLDMATLTGAARVALGSDLPAFFTDDEKLSEEIQAACAAVHDPLWRLPLWKTYNRKMKSDIADLRNVTSDGYAGAITAALFLQRFVKHTKAWAHFDMCAWNSEERGSGPKGGEMQCVRALEDFLVKRYG